MKQTVPIRDQYPFDIIYIFFSYTGVVDDYYYTTKKNR